VEGDPLDAAEQRLRDLLGDDAYASARALGEARAVEQVVAQAVTDLQTVAELTA
jgi:hypothetical protein